MMETLQPPFQLTPPSGGSSLFQMHRPNTCPSRNICARNRICTQVWSAAPTAPLVRILFYPVRCGAANVAISLWSIQLRYSYRMFCAVTAVNNHDALRLFLLNIVLRKEQEPQEPFHTVIHLFFEAMKNNILAFSHVAPFYCPTIIFHSHHLSQTRGGIQRHEVLGTYCARGRALLVRQ